MKKIHLSFFLNTQHTLIKNVKLCTQLIICWEIIENLLIIIHLDFSINFRGQLKLKFCQKQIQTVYL